MDTTKRQGRLSASIQPELISLFVAGVSARTAAELEVENRNTVILYCHKLHEMIADRLAEDAPFSMEKLKSTRAPSVVGARGSVEEGLPGKCRSLAFANVAARCTRS
jgi:transposase-like protein